MYTYATIPKQPAMVQTVTIHTEKEIQPYYEVKAEVTAYTSSIKDCGKSDGITASGVRASRGMIAAPVHIPFGTIMEINGQVYTVTDRGGLIKVKPDGTYVIDVWLPNQAEVEAFGRKKMVIKIYGRKR